MNNSNVTAGLAGQTLSRVGLGYGIAIAVGILVLVSTIMLASYVCARVHGREAFVGMRSLRTTFPGEGLTPAPVGQNPAAAGAEWVIPGLDEATLATYPKIVYSPQHPLPGHSTQDTACSICLADYNDEEVLRMLPDCRHVFHANCIDSWLRLHATCPMCRSSPMPTPISTPLSELIPLARNPLQNRSS